MSEIAEAVRLIRLKQAAVPGFCPSVADLLEACADDPGEAGRLAQAVAGDVLGPLGACTCTRGGVLLHINETCPHHGEE